MKKLIYFVVLLVVALAITPWMTGILFKQQFSQFVVALNQDKRIKISILDYQQGWFSSTIKLDAAQTMGPVKISFIENVTHGPVIYDKTKRTFIFAIAMIETTFHLPVQIVQSAIHLSTIVTFNNHWQNQINVPSMHFDSPTVLINWQGLTGQSDLAVTNDRISAIQSNFSIGAIAATSKQPGKTSMQLNVAPITVTYDGTRHPVGLWVGNSSINITNALLKDPTNKSIHVQNLQLSMKSNINASALYNGSEQITVGKIDMPTAVVTSVSPINFIFTANNFNAKGIVNLANYLRTIQPNDLSDDTSKSKLMTYIANTLTPTTYVESNASLTTPLGNVTLSGKATQFSATATTFSDLMKSSSLQANVRMAIPLTRIVVNAYLGNQPNNVTPINERIDNPSADQFNDKVATLLQQGKLTLPTSLQILTLSNQNSTLDQFTTGISNLKLPTDVITDLTQTYAQLLQNKQKAIVTTQDDPIADWLKHGYLIQDNSDYVISITNDKGVLKLNGNALQ